MNTRLTIKLFAAAVLAAALAVAWAVAAASPAASAPAAAKQTRVFTIVMKDPGCHWFRVAGKNKIRLTVHGKTGFRNLDEAAVVFKGKGYLRRVAVGKTLFVGKAGVYRIKMVGQHPDDNVLVLTVK